MSTKVVRNNSITIIYLLSVLIYTRDNSVRNWNYILPAICAVSVSAVVN